MNVPHGTISRILVHWLAAMHRRGCLAEARGGGTNDKLLQSTRLLALLLSNDRDRGEGGGGRLDERTTIGGASESTAIIRIVSVDCLRLRKLLLQLLLSASPSPLAETKAACGGDRVMKCEDALLASLIVGSRFMNK
jgi:hypothetical protein